MYLVLQFSIDSFEITQAGLELNRFLAGACRAPRLKNLGAWPNIPVPGYLSGLPTNPFLAGVCRAPSLKNLGARRKILVPGAPVNFEPCTGIIHRFPYWTGAKFVPLNSELTLFSKRILLQFGAVFHIM